MKMLRGCQKRIYFMKNTGSSYFEEAYFILKNDISESTAGDGSRDLAREADRIIKESSVYYRGGGKRGLALSRAAMFALGAASSSAVIGLIALLIAI